MGKVQDVTTKNSLCSENFLEKPLNMWLFETRVEYEILLNYLM